MESSRSILMRWLLDQGMPRSAADILNRAYQDAIHVGDIGMAEAPDSSILQYALSENRIVVTLDADFHSLLALSGSSKPSVIRIREEGLKGAALAALILQIAKQFRNELETGCVMTFQAGKIRQDPAPSLAALIDPCPLRRSSQTWLRPPAAERMKCESAA